MNRGISGSWTASTIAARSASAISRRRTTPSLSPVTGNSIDPALTGAQAGATWVVIAGKPRDGVYDSCAMGVDALEFLNLTRERLA